MGAGNFLPGGLIQTAAHAAAAGVRRAVRSTGRRRKRRSSRATLTVRRGRTTVKASSGSRGSRSKPRPGTKAWMSYIRGLRGKKRRAK